MQPPPPPPPSIRILKDRTPSQPRPNQALHEGQLTGQDTTSHPVKAC